MQGLLVVALGWAALRVRWFTPGAIATILLVMKCLQVLKRLLGKGFEE